MHAFIVFLLNMICMHDLFNLSFMFVVHACFLGIEHGYMGAFSLSFLHVLVVSTWLSYTCSHCLFIFQWKEEKSSGGLVEVWILLLLLSRQIIITLFCRFCKELLNNGKDWLE